MPNPTTRRAFLAHSAKTVAALGLATLLPRSLAALTPTLSPSPENLPMPATLSIPTTITPISKPDAEWQKILPPEAFKVLRQHGTERAGTSPLNAEKRPGVFTCAGCTLPLFSSAHKFESGTGWPSFYRPIAPHVVGTKADRSLLFMPRTEVYCARCEGHLGHVFEDGPAPTGLRYCINGVALGFVAA